jgi:membrane associated rhomboid family serine protease
MSDQPQFPLPSFPTEFPRRESSIPLFYRNLLTVTPIAWVTPLIIGANVLLFVVMVVSGVGLVEPDSQKMIAWGAGYGPATTNGQPWRLFTEMFIHFGILHIAINMFILWQVGAFVERLFGNLTYLLIYILSGLCGSYLSLLAHPLSVAGGASGAIFGIFGALLGFLCVQRGAIPVPILRSLMRGAVIFVVFNMAFSFWQKEIDMQAHAGGLVSGFVLGMVLSRRIVRRGNLIRSILVTGIGGLAVFYVFHHLQPIPDLDAELQHMAAADDNAANLFNRDSQEYSNGQLTDAQFADSVATQLLPQYRDAHRRLQSLSDVPKEALPLWKAQLAEVADRQATYESLFQALHDEDDVEIQQSLEQCSNLGKSAP